MRKFAIVVDSTADLCLEMRKKYDIDYAAMKFVMDGEEHKASLDWEEMSAHEFYDLMRRGKRITTTQVPRDEFERCFNAHLDAGEDVLYISCSSALSGSINLAKVIAKELAQERSDGEVICVDSLISSFGQGALAIMASKLRAEGKTLRQTAEAVENNRLKYNQFGYLDTLEYLSRAGRMKASKAFFGNLFGVKPILISDAVGQNYAVKKAKGSANARREVAKMVAETAVDAANHTLFISHADDPEAAQALKEEILALVPFGGVHVDYIGPIVGASVGPGTLIAFCYGKEVTIEGKE